MTYEQTTDLDLVKDILTHKSIYEGAKDDYSPAPENIRLSKDRYYILVKDMGKIEGVFILEPHSHILWEVHIGLLPDLWGKAADVVKEFTGWLWEQSSCLRLIANVPIFNHLVRKLAIDSGFTVFGLNPKAFQKGNELHDLVMFGLSKPGV